MCLEEVEVTKEQMRELHAYLEEQGIDVVEADGRPPKSDGGAWRSRAEQRQRRPMNARRSRST